MTEQQSDRFEGDAPVNRTLDKIAPYPQTPDEVTAKTLATAIAARAYAAHVTMLRLPADPADRDLREYETRIQAVLADVGLVEFLEALCESDESVANLVAREVWQAWRDGWNAAQGLAWTLRGLGVDPDEVAAAARLDAEAAA